MVTDAISHDDCETLKGCLIHRVDPLYPHSDMSQHYAA